MEQHRVWPTVVGVMGLLLGLVLCSCGIMQSVATAINPEPIVVMGTIELPSRAVAALGFGVYSIVALFFAGVGVIIWSTYGPRSASKPRRAQLLTALLLLCGVLCGIWTVLAGGSGALIGQDLAALLDVPSTNTLNIILPMLMCGSVTVMFLAAGSAVWWFYVRKPAV